MPFFRMRLILALALGITLISVASTYFDVLSHKLVLRRELERRSVWLGASLQPQMEQALSAGGDALSAAVAQMQRPVGAGGKAGNQSDHRTDMGRTAQKCKTAGQKDI